MGLLQLAFTWGGKQDRIKQKHHMIVNAEGIGHSTSMAKRIEAATGVETRATILGYMQRGGNPTCTDRYYASIMGAYAADILVQGKSNRVVAFKNGTFVDYAFTWGGKQDRIKHSWLFKNVHDKIDSSATMQEQY